jgi:antitoxin component YwqK of YwqJK toxin-antitoxin module
MKSALFFFSFFVGIVSFAQAVNRTDANGKKQGPWEKTYPKSRAYEYKGQFKDDKPVGTFTYYYPSTKVKAVIKHDEKSGRSSAIMYHENGLVMAKGIYRNQLKDSIWDYYGPSGRQSLKETYTKDKLNGTTTVYYIPEEVGDKRIIVAKTSVYLNGVLHGDMIEYFDTGIIKSKVKYVNGVKEGVMVTNHPNGKPMMTERYKKGVPHGWQTAHDQTGKEIGKKYYCYGELLEGKRLEDRLKECKAKGISPNG